MRYGLPPLGHLVNLTKDRLRGNLQGEIKAHILINSFSFSLKEEDPGFKIRQSDVCSDEWDLISLYICMRTP